MRGFSEGSRREFGFFVAAVVVLLTLGPLLWSNAGAQEGVQPTTPVQTQSSGRPAYNGTEQMQVHAAPAVFEERIPIEQLQFLKGYTGEAAKKLTKDKQFNALLKQVEPKSEFHYGRDMSLAEAVDTMMHSGHVRVALVKDRYVMVASSVGSYLGGRAFLWVDTEQGIGLGGVFFRPVNGEPAPTLAIFTKQLRVSELKMSQLPLEFVGAVRAWSAELKLPEITPRYFIPESGRKYLLEHDEELCAGDIRKPVVGESECLQRKVDAAEVDVEAAAFITRLHNAANATAWELNGQDAEQKEWMEKRKKSCGTSAGSLDCWMRMTHERTEELIARRKQ
jgi:hypothetical protein